MKDFKIKISCPEHSEFVQKKLFKLGYFWGTGKFIKLEKNKILFAHADGFISSCIEDHKEDILRDVFGLAGFHDRTDHPGWCWPRSHALGDIKERVARNAGTKHKKDKIPLHIKAERYIAENPEIYKLFRRFSWEAIYAGRETLSAGFITERIRWEAMVIGNDEYKINNNYRAYMARQFMSENPHLGEIFRTRVTKKEKGAE